MPFQAKVILDSVTDYDVRLTTMELTYPLIVHNELLTHRAIGRSDDEKFDQWLEFSRNSSSNRALAPKKIRQAVIEDPYVPDFVAATSGMQGGSILDEAEQRRGRAIWLRARDDAIRSFDEYESLGVKVHKQHRNRLLGPFQFITVVATANEDMWRHFFSLRNHVAAQPDIARIAYMASLLWDDSVPQLLKDGEWHTPYVVRWPDSPLDEEQEKQISVARCARTSYLRQGEIIEVKEDFALYNRLASSRPPHGSPFEHVAQATTPDVRSGNFVGFLQYRKELGI